VELAELCCHGLSEVHVEADLQPGWWGCESLVLLVFVRMTALCDLKLLCRCKLWQWAAQQAFLCTARLAVFLEASGTICHAC
jgi:hypothetical protein